MFKKINTLEQEEPVYLKEVATGKRRKLLLEAGKKNPEDKEIFAKSNDVEEFLNLIICTTSITRMLNQNKNLSEDERMLIETEKQKIISAIGTLADTLELEKDLAEKNIVAEKKKLNEGKKKTIPKEDVIVHNLSEDVIPVLKFLNIIDRINSIVESYEEICVDLEYEKNNEIYLDLIRIENALTNIESTIACELKDKIKEVK